MIRRPLMAAALTCAAILPLGLVLPGLAAPPKPKVQFSNPKLSASTVASGGSVTASIVVKPTGGATVSSVTLRVVKSSPAITSAMTASGTKWSKGFTAPSNISGKTLSVDVWADAQTSLGARSSKIGTLKVKTGTIDPNSPPPPPPI